MRAAAAVLGCEFFGLGFSLVFKEKHSSLEDASDDLTKHEASTCQAKLVFDEVSEKWLKRYSPSGNEEANSPDSALNISLYFEHQFGHVDLTPTMLLDARGVDLHGHTCDGPGPAFPTISPYFSLGCDGGSTGEMPSHIYMEVETRMLTPSEVLYSNMTAEFEEFFQRHTEHWHGKPLLQYTVGLPLSAVPSLMAGSAASRFHASTAKIAGNKPQEYQALVSLAAMTVYTVTRPSRVCGHTKDYVEPWLVRTHFGDMSQYVASKYGASILSGFVKDVLSVSNISSDALPFPAGIVAYDKFPELAEMSGLVMTRDCHANQTAKPKYKMPVTFSGLCELASLMINDTASPIKGKWTHCAKPHDPTLQSRWPASTGKWLEGLLRGSDLWTDGEAAMAQETMIFKSMGSWRMKKAGHVFLESRGRVSLLDPELKKLGFPTSGLGIPRERHQPGAAMKAIANKIISLLT